jgi:hypothetical protein
MGLARGAQGARHSGDLTSPLLQFIVHDRFGERTQGDEHILPIADKGWSPLRIKTAYQLGANSYVVKPVDSDAFMEAMSNLGFYWLLVNQTLE